MGKSKKPSIQESEIPTLPTGELEQHLISSYFRNRQNVNALRAGTLNHAYVAFEALQMIMPVLQDGHPHSVASKAYPVASWRAKTVEIPTELLDVLVSCFAEYASTEKSLGESFGFDAINRQGSKSMRDRQRQQNKYLRYASEVHRRYIEIDSEPTDSLETIYGQIGQEFGVSAKTVERAHKAFPSAESLEKILAIKGLFPPDTTSRSSAVED